eukprot:CAMPEP_0117055832 /NCGR_PEP_ID=MMETSP0472-20121206/38727_1 /TAXON_ID=693140 ORGANISM="Tiarina fusus, Strain LIS" /NCGR_SAMPLE_ID=MMETSP0472 /ASSEMBLY_ACC=CAM_ASM_000603 /LENGTH=712 /DNA_ID=CAMNT_0004772025 /DNA_START=151 /DNA_END=2290 /DNA_ORIENTATION=-
MSTGGEAKKEKEHQPTTPLSFDARVKDLRNAHTLAIVKLSCRGLEALVNAMSSEIQFYHGDPRSKSASQVSENQTADIPSPSKKAKSAGETIPWEMDFDSVKATNTETQLTKTWGSLLNEKLSIRQATRKSTRLTGASQTSLQPESQVSKGNSTATAADSQPFSQGSVVSEVSEVSEYKQCDSMGKAMGEEFVGKTLRGALDHLIKKRDQASGDFEIKYTQWVVNRLLAAALPSFQELAKQPENRSWLSPLVKMQEKITIGFYAETEHSKKASVRCPDSAFFLQGTGDDPCSGFNREVSGLANLICFEHKSSLSVKQKKRDALLELKRDYVQKLRAVDILGPQIGYGVVTDGIEWSFVKIEARRQGRKEEAGLLVYESETVNVYNGKNYNFQELAKFLTFTFTKSIVESKLSKSPFVNVQDEDDKELLENVQFDATRRFKITRILATERFFVAKAATSEQKDVVLKIVYKQERNRARRMLVELDNLRILKDCPAVVNLAVGYGDDQTSVPPFLVLEDAGEPLDKLVVSGNAGKELAKVVKRDIWGTALKALRLHKLVHADLHPGNICVRECNGELQALIVDLESAVQEGGELAESPIKHREDLLCSGQKAELKMDESMVIAILQSLWQKGSFHELIRCVKELKGMRDEDFKKERDQMLGIIKIVMQAPPLKHKEYCNHLQATLSLRTPDLAMKFSKFVVVNYAFADGLFESF